jgi:hypothetical protein
MLLVAAVALGACGSDDDGEAVPSRAAAVPWLDPQGEFPVVGSLSVNPAGGALWMATNTPAMRRSRGLRSPSSAARTST